MRAAPRGGGGGYQTWSGVAMEALICLNGGVIWNGEMCNKMVYLNTKLINVHKKIYDLKENLKLQ